MRTDKIITHDFYFNLFKMTLTSLLFGVCFLWAYYTFSDYFLLPISEINYFTFTIFNISSSACYIGAIHEKSAGFKFYLKEALEEDMCVL